MTSWLAFWNRKQSIYVSARHVEVYHEALGKGILELLPSRRPLTMLDWGCGDAFSARALQHSGIQVLLHDPVPNVHDRISNRFREDPDIRVLSESELSLLPSKSVDVIFIYSVLQYISKQDFEKLIPQFREMLLPGGVLLLGDIVPASLSMFADVLDLLKAGFRYGFFIDAMIGIISTFFSDYRLVRRTNGFTTYYEKELIGLLNSYGFRTERIPKNIGLSAHRMLFKAAK